MKATPAETETGFSEELHTRNNPLKFIDPSGREIKPGQGADPVFFAQAIQAFDKAAATDTTGRVQQAYDRIKSSDNAFYIAPGDTERSEPLDPAAASNGKGSGGNATFNEAGQPGENGEQLPSEEVAAHLLSHFEDYDSGTLDRSPECKGCAPVTEGKAVRMENLVRDPKHPRTTHDGRRVPNPTAAPKTPNSTPKSHGGGGTRHTTDMCVGGTC